MKRNLTVLAAGLLATGLIAACGGDDDGDAISKEDFIAQADAICGEDNAAIEQAGQSVKTQADVEAFVTETIVPTLRDESQQIRDLGAPEGDEDEVNAILDSLDSGLDEMEANPGQVTDEANNPLGEASQLARDYGLKVCGQE